MPPRGRGILDSRIVHRTSHVESFGLCSILEIFYYFIELISAFIVYFMVFTLCMLMIEPMRLVWRFLISPFSGNFLAQVSGRYMKFIYLRDFHYYLLISWPCIIMSILSSSFHLSMHLPPMLSTLCANPYLFHSPYRCRRSRSTHSSWLVELVEISCGESSIVRGHRHFTFYLLHYFFY